MTLSPARGVVWALVVLALMASPVLGLATPYVSLLLILPLFVVTLSRRMSGASYSSYDARAFLAVFVALALIFAMRADSIADALHSFNFVMLLVYGSVAGLFRTGPVRIRGEVVARLALAGTAVGFLEVAASALLGQPRATGINIGPIVLSNAVLALGYISWAGVLLREDRWSWLYVLGPVLAIATVIMTGSRGPLLAIAPAVLVGAVWLWKSRFEGDLRIALVGVAMLVVAAAGAIAAVLNTRASSLLQVVESMLRGSGDVGESVRQRLVLWDAGARAFAAEPWLGHGWANIMNTVRPLLPPEDVHLAELPQLHNDVLNFAVAGGVVGVVCYVAIVSTPLVAAFRGPRDSLRSFRLFGATMLTLVYVGGGLTDLMFGFEFHTYLFVMLTAILLGVRPPNDEAVP